MAPAMIRRHENLAANRWMTKTRAERGQAAGGTSMGRRWGLQALGLQALGLMSGAIHDARRWRTFC